MRRYEAYPRRDGLTVDNHADGPYLFLYLQKSDPEAAQRAYDLLAWNGGGRYSSGVGIADVDTQGNVHPDQFWQSAVLGNVKERPFSEIWTDPKNDLLALLRDRLPHLHGRCASCRFLPLCGGNFRVRALATGDMWAPDPACYLTDEEIGVA
jgi:radical SAM protein with 4Fe4S-binding SPASM domain